jgi:acyl-coenzyme A thioesterase PaaI-like protein
MNLVERKMNLCQHSLQGQFFSTLHFKRELIMTKAFQDYYPESYSHCYGCGSKNEHGLQIKSYWDGDESIAVFHPEKYHLAFTGYVYGGLIASLIDCHSTGTAAAAAYREEQRAMDTLPPFRFVTASLHVDYLLPTPLGPPIQLRSRVVEIKGRKVVIETDCMVDEKITAKGKVVAVQIPDHLLAS